MRARISIGICLALNLSRVWPVPLLLLSAGVLVAASGCAVLAGGAAGAATGYVAGHEAADGD